MASLPVTALILTKNEEQMLPGCIQTLRWCEHIHVLDRGSSDSTLEIAKKLGTRIAHSDATSYATLRQEQLKDVKTPWVLYIDPDERITPQLYQEIEQALRSKSASALTFRRENILYGKKVSHGGYEADTVTRLFEVEALQKWVGNIHESPQYVGQSQLCESPLLHLTHRDIVSGLKKSAQWTPLEAQLLYAGGTSKVTVITLLRKTLMEFVRRFFLKHGFRDGQVGFIEALIQAWNRCIVYMQVWELQQNPSAEQRYAEIDTKLSKSWSSGHKKD